MASIKKMEERKFKITVCNGYHADGKKICKSKTIRVPDNIKRRSIQQYVMHEAEELERVFRLGYAENADMTFEQYAFGWLGRQQHYKPSTLAGHRMNIRVCCEYIGGIQIQKIRPLTIEHFLEELRKRPSRRGGVLKEVTVQKYLGTISVVLEDAVRNAILPHNPVRMVSLPPATENKQIIPTKQEMEILLKEIQKQPLVYQVYYMLDLCTGARRGELCALTWADVSPTEIIISKSRGHVSGVGLVTGATKNGHTRVVAITVSMCMMLSTLLCAYSKEGIHITDQMNVFLNRHGQPINPSTFTHNIRKVYDKCGLPKDYHLHTLRHYAATMWLQNNTSKQVVAQILGHGDTSFLERTYCHPQMECLAQAAEQSQQMLVELLPSQNTSVLSTLCKKVSTF